MSHRFYRQTGAPDFPDARPGGQANATLKFRAFLILSLLQIGDGDDTIALRGSC